MIERLEQGSGRLQTPVYILQSGSVVGTKEGQGPLGELFDSVGKDDLFGEADWEEAESALQKKAVELALAKANVEEKEIDVLYSGDLLGQGIASSFGIADYHIPYMGLYGACSTCGEALILGCEAIESGLANRAVCVTSSHFASAEKEFRFPLDYGNQRPLSATWTVTGSAAFVLGNERAAEQYKKDLTSVVSGGYRRPRAKITGFTVGKIVDFGLKDSMNMGPCMAPAAADTILRHFADFDTSPAKYDAILTGDLGKVGRQVLIDLCLEKGYDISANHNDCGMLLFDCEKQDVHSGGSGCGCSAVTLAAYVLKQLEEGKWKKVLFVPTGALLSKVSFNEGRSVPGVAHAVVLETV